MLQLNISPESNESCHRENYLFLDLANVQLVLVIDVHHFITKLLLHILAGTAKISDFLDHARI